MKIRTENFENNIDAPGYTAEYRVHTVEESRILWNLRYLDRVREEFEEAGGMQLLTDSEEMATEFRSNLKAVRIVRIAIGGKRKFCHRSTIVFRQNLQACTKQWKKNQDGIPDSTFLIALCDLYAGEHAIRFSKERFGCFHAEGINWKLEFKYDNGHSPVLFHGGQV